MLINYLKTHTMRKIFILLTTVLGCTLNLVQAQSINMGQGTTHTATGCAMTVHDYGGITADYAPNRDDTLTIYSNSSSNSGTSVRPTTGSSSVSRPSSSSNSS